MYAVLQALIWLRGPDHDIRSEILMLKSDQNPDSQTGQISPKEKFVAPKWLAQQVYIS